MNRAEGAGKHKGSRPELSSLRQRELGIAAKTKFLVKPDDQKEYGPKGGPAQKLCSVNCQCSEMIAAEGRDHADDDADFRETEKRSAKKLRWRGAARRKAV